MGEVTEMLKQISFLEREKNEAVLGMEQAAEHGLLLLQQKSQLQRDLAQANELNGKALMENEELRAELELKNAELEQILESAHDNRRNQMLTSIVNEETLLQGTMALEDKLQNELKRARDELSTARQQNHNDRQEVERLTKVNNILNSDLERLEAKVDPLVKAQKEAKEAEKRLISDFNEIEEENCQLQRSLVYYKEQQLAVDELQHAIARLEEDSSFWKAKSEEEESIKNVLQSQLEECLTSLEREREEKMALRRELNEINIPSPKRNHLLNPENVMLPDSPGKDGDQQRMSDKIQRVEIEKECLLRELENSSEMDMIRQRAQGELERLKRENSRLSGRIAQLEQDQHENRKQQATADHFENRLSDLQKQFNVEKERADNNDKDVLKARDHLASVSEQIASMYHLLCLSKGTVPERILLRRTVQNCNQTLNKNGAEEKSAEDMPKDAPKVEDEKQTQLKSPSTVESIAETLNEQVRLIKSTINDQMNDSKSSSSSDKENAAPDETEADRDSEVIGLKALISSKNERIATLRTVLKANKTTAESALASLRQKYDDEREMVNETMAKLRSELRTLKEDAAVFASLRSVFSARCDEYVLQLDELTRQLKAAEEEKKTLNRLLRMAIEQKLALTQQLDDINFEVETLRNSSTKR
ncbi:Oidioi.mRNA.OKI2018_I69.PAR.g11125.t1.cds [Oikopleura dioica]|uniref:Oidioi.mRNA.OKI2018_I69.PAR.g11125.t1.cds n=1 Tax=Oikopleura dioica TaxID=34765 RepID=A0ABN7S1H9_OIKDI|nr:Oidioi.mRNA.OKI2018_I69.PAR.g11125.t1.cds [Oikopleura dioica]